ncbi:unnamed protein product [Rhizophagus irregularis]|nr:unnamed protein product [Rhizophagus irregularis]
MESIDDLVWNSEVQMEPIDDFKIQSTIWQESPLFGCEKILLNNVTYFTGDFVHYIHHNTGSFVKIGRIRAFVMDENGNLKAKI